MPGLTSGELEDFVDAVDRTVTRTWPSAKTAGEADTAERLSVIWRQAVEQGWTDLAAERAFDAVLATMGRLGRVGCPFPLVDVYVAAGLFGELPDVAAGISSGEIRPVVAIAGVQGSRVRFVEAAASATHVVVLGAAHATLVAIAERVEVAGLARPKWSDVDVEPDEVARVECGADAIEDAKVLLRTGLAARAIGAADRAVEFSIEHAKTRRAFGKPIGAFQAVSHRAVDGAVDVTVSRQMLAEAVATYLAGRDDWQLTAELAVAYTGPAAIRAQFGAHHTLAAMGYFEDHDAPWLFRRVNADVSQLDAIVLAAGSPADVLIDSEHSLPFLELGEAAEHLRAEVREFMAPYLHDRPVARDVPEPQSEAFAQAAADKGYWKLGWPTEFGGRAASVEEMMVLADELTYQRFPLWAKKCADMLGLAIIRFGTKEQQERTLPLIASGHFDCFLGYSEPEVGSDLANLSTRAVRDGDEWVINGRKIWSSFADESDWVWIAVRTDPDATPPHAGITVFLSKVDRPGFEFQRYRSLYGEISCATFFDDFRVSDDDRIGEVNEGWKVITEALAMERVAIAYDSAIALRLFDDLLAEIRKDVNGTVGSRGSAKRALVNDIAARLQAARLIVISSVRATASVGGGARLEAPMAKILATGLLEDFGEAVLRIFGPSAALGQNEPDTPGRGAFEYNLRRSIMRVVGGGTVDIQRNLISRSLGIPAK